jgi:preprotein translocase subunit SecB
MAEEKKTDTASNGEDKQNFSIQKIYTKNVSFESPNSPEIFLKQFKPQLDVDLNIEAKGLEKGVHHVLIRVTATIKVEDKTAFLCEVEQAGIFAISGFPDADLQYLLAVGCPSTLFPYAREAVSDLVTKGGFPQLLLEPVNFDAMYASHVQKAQETGQSTATKQ